MKTYTTNRPLDITIRCFHSGLEHKVHVPMGMRVRKVKDATYCTKRKVRVDGYALTDESAKACDAYFNEHSYYWIPDNAVAGRPADAVLVRRGTGNTKDEWQVASDKWRVNIGGEVFDYFTGVGHRARRAKTGNFEPVAPTYDDVLYCLLGDADAENMSFEEWCDNFGFDSDSRKALATYLQCQETAHKLRKAGIKTEAERERLEDY